MREKSGIDDAQVHQTLELRLGLSLLLRDISRTYIRTLESVGRVRSVYMVLRTRCRTAFTRTGERSLRDYGTNGRSARD